MLSQDSTFHHNFSPQYRGAVVGIALFLSTGLTPAVAGDEQFLGKWEGPYDWPVVAVHAALLPDGQVLAYDSVGDDATETYPQNVTQTRAMLWDPNTNSSTYAELGLGYNIFCSGLALLSNGHLFIAGGNLNTPQAQLQGITNLTDYDTFSSNNFSDRFSAAGAMNYGRWYPSITALENGEMVITGGVNGGSSPEVRQVDGSVRELVGAHDSFASTRLYEWLKLAPNGNVAYLGPREELRYLHTDGVGSWEHTGQHRDDTYRTYGSHALYNVDKVLVAGGGGNATDSAVTISLNTLDSAATGSMHFARRQHNLTVLADGSVLATGGFSGSALNFDYGNAVYAAERWDPQSGQWSTLASMQVHRAYHSTALLLPDGRVLNAGGGICSDCTGQYLQKNAEVYSPPYLFRQDGSGELAMRPIITAAPSEINTQQRFIVRVARAMRIKSVALVRLGTVTHSTNMEQRYIPLRFKQRTKGKIVVWGPSDNRIAPPGYYMLFVCRGAGVPSVAKILKVSGGQTISYTQ